MYIVAYIFNQIAEVKNISYRITDRKVRKFANHIRSNGIMPLIATQKGYYTTKNGIIYNSVLDAATSLEINYYTLIRILSNKSEYYKQKNIWQLSYV